MSEIVLKLVARARFYFFIKQVADLLISLVMLIFLSPLFLLLAIIIKFDSSGPVFFLQERVGKDGKLFTIIKFRTMVKDAEKNGPQMAKVKDKRITRVGHLLRKYRLDELPQLFNVVSGDMSLIGPRPERLYFIDKFEESVPDFRKRLDVRPGITGLAQTIGGYDMSPKEKLELDLYYIQKCSLLLDLKIIFRSLHVVLFAKGWR